MAERFLVDGLNLIGSKPTGWWRDRRAAMRGLVEELEGYASQSGDELAVVFDGRPFVLSSELVDVAFASRGGPNAADDDIAARVEADPSPETLTVVTSDAELAQRVREFGARNMGVRSFRERLDQMPP